MLDFRRFLSFFFLLGSFFFVAGCAADEPVLTPTAVIPTTLPTRPLVPTEIAPTPEPTVISVPSTPLPTSTQANLSTEVPQPTETIQLTATPAPTATPLLSTLPDWFMEPTANILLLVNQGRPNMTVFNADNGELRVMNKQTILDTIEEELGGLPTDNRDILSPNGRYQAQTIRQEGGMESVTILDKETNTKTALFNPFLHHKTLNEDFDESVVVAYWSPDGEFLSVLYDKHYYSDKYDRNLAIYKPSGEIFRQYANMDTSWENPWTPAAPYKILYTNRGMPCYLEVMANKTTCLEIFKEWLISQSINPFHYSWSPDGKQISFVHSNTVRTGLCYIELETEKVVCPITSDDLHLDEQLFARIQFWSPDGKYLVLFFDDIGFVDVIGPLRVAVVDIEGQHFQLLEGTYHWPKSNPWRPPIPSQSE